jgi:hypothetical protein
VETLDMHVLCCRVHYKGRFVALPSQSVLGCGFCSTPPLWFGCLGYASCSLDTLSAVAWVACQQQQWCNCSCCPCTVSFLCVWAATLSHIPAVEALICADAVIDVGLSVPFEWWHFVFQDIVRPLYSGRDI